MCKRPLVLMLGITGNLAFAAGCLLLALRRHSPALGADILLYHDEQLSETDRDLLRGLGAETRLFQPVEGEFRPEAMLHLSPLSLARLEGFLLLEKYRTFVWLDVDTAIQGDITPLTSYGPLSMAFEDPYFTDHVVTTRSAVNVYEPVPELNGAEPNFNSGVLVLRDDLPDPGGKHRQCLEWLRIYGPKLKYPDQAVLNMLAQKLQAEEPDSLVVLPHDLFNAHIRNPAAGHAVLAHGFGAYKLWDDGLTRCLFPEWDRDYRHWIEIGGSPWSGEVDNEDWLEGGAFFQLRRLFDKMVDAQRLLERQQGELEKERMLRRRLEQTLRNLEQSQTGPH